MSLVMNTLEHLIQKNKIWADSLKKKDPNFFSHLSSEQKPKYLWIGCSDSRVPVNQIIGLSPGEVFVHRNIANQVIHTDLNCLSVIQFAVDVLKIKEIIVCGHYGCGGIQASLDNKDLGLVDNWLRHIKDIYRIHRDAIDSITNENDRVNLLCELNVMEQVLNVCYSNIIQQNWSEGREISVYGCIYDLKNGLIKNLKANISNNDQLKMLDDSLSSNKKT